MIINNVYPNIINAGSTTSNKKQSIDEKLTHLLLYFIKCKPTEKNYILSKNKFNLPDKFKIDNKHIKNNNHYTQLRFYNSNYEILMTGKFYCNNDIIYSCSKVNVKSNYEKDNTDLIIDSFSQLF
jgi:hypothetical protein